MSVGIGESSQAAILSFPSADGSQFVKSCYRPIRLFRRAEIDKHTQNPFRLWMQFLSEIQFTSEVAPKLEKSDLLCARVATCHEISDLHLFEPVPVFGYSVIFAPIAVINFLTP